ncbi:hypothetical protein Aperf_G00000006409 [Anoplocephala perfoliata]
MDASLVSTLLDESNLRGFLRDGALHMQVKPGTKVRNLTNYVSTVIDSKFSAQIFCWALPGAIEKVVPFAEQVKRIWNSKAPSDSSSSNFFQCTRPFFHLCQSRIGEYLVKANKPAMAIVLSRHELVEDLDNPPTTAVVLTAEQEIPGFETPFPSRRKKCHQEKKRRPDTSGRDVFSGLKKKKKPKNEKPSKQRTSEKEGIFDPCYRLIPAQKLSEMSVARVGRRPT